MPVEFKQDSIKEWLLQENPDIIEEIVQHGCSGGVVGELIYLSLIHISEPTRPY